MWAIGLALAYLAVAAGLGVLIARFEADRLRSVLLLSALAGAAAGLVVALAGRDDDVPWGQFAGGIAFGVVFLGAAPMAAYATLGLWLARRPIWLLVAWAVSLAPLVPYGLFVLFGVVDLTQCEPGAYECPL